MKTDVVPCTKEEMDRLIQASSDNHFYYMLFNVAKKTGRRLGELYGNRKRKEIGRKIVGKKVEYDEKGKPIALSKTRAIYKTTNEYEGGVKVKDIDFDEGLMKIWVLKRRKLIQDETILTKDLLQLIKHYIVLKKLKKDDYLFREVSYRAIQQAVNRYSKKAGIEHKVTFHNFRHYFVTELMRKGKSRDVIMKLTGHKSSQSLSSYDHIVAKDIKESIKNDLEEI